MSRNILAVSYAKRALEPGSRERERMRQYAEVVDQYAVIVFTRAHEGYPAVQQDGPLTLYATNARTKIGMLYRAYRLGRTVLRQSGSKRWIISCQDPFASAVVGRWLVRATTHVLHVQVHGDIYNQHVTDASPMARVQLWYARYVLRRATHIRVVSARIKRSLVERGIASDTISVLPIQADLTRFLVVGRDRALTDTGTELRLLYAGRLAPEKNLPLLLQAVAQLVAESVPVQLKVVGAGPEETRLKAWVVDNNLGQVVTFIPWTDNIETEFAWAQVFCLTSNHEGWAMVLQEAAAARLAIVTTDVGCAGEFIRHEQEGLVVPVGDVTEFTAAVRRLHDDRLRNDLATRAYTAARSSTDTYVADWVATYPDLAD